MFFSVMQFFCLFFGWVFFLCVMLSCALGVSDLRQPHIWVFLVDINREIQLQLLGNKKFPWELERSYQGAVNLSFLEQKWNSVQSTNNFSLSRCCTVNRSSDPLNLCWTRTPQCKMRGFCKLGVSRSVRGNVSCPRHCQGVLLHLPLCLKTQWI